MASSPPSSARIQRRQVLSLPVIILLFTAATPFTPVAWLTGSLSGSYLFDRFVAGFILLCACYFQWTISGLTYPTVVTLANPLAHESETYIHDGRIHGSKRGGGRNMSEVTFIYQPSRYYMYTTFEIAALLVAEFAGVELVRRFLVLVVVGALWAVGWTVTPDSTKRWAWNRVKAIWFFVVLDLVRDIGFGGGFGGGTRRRR